jgi:hypothetical protein
MTPFATTAVAMARATPASVVEPPSATVAHTQSRAVTVVAVALLDTPVVVADTPVAAAVVVDIDSPPARSIGIF